MSDDGVNHPGHYNQYSAFEVIDVCEQLRAPDGSGNFNRGNAFKYLARAGWKNPDKHVEDLEKAKFYIQREIDRVASNNWMDSDPRLAEMMASPMLGLVPPVGENLYFGQIAPTIVLEEKRPLCSTCKQELSLIRTAKLGCVNKDCEQGLKNLNRLVHGA